MQDVLTILTCLTTSHVHLNLLTLLQSTVQFVFLLQSQNYDHKADIYSLGIIFWEMWYGRDAADYIQQQLFGPLETAIKNGLRPSLKINTKAPDNWIELIERSWDFDPALRPSIDKHCHFFEEFLHNARKSNRR